MSSLPSDEKPVYVLVFAHPDDESMFFLPTIGWLVDQGQQVWFLCLTTGNYDGLGSVREKELEQAGILLGASKVIIRNDNNNSNAAILDHPTKRYDKQIVAKAIQDSLSKYKEQNFVLISFDEMGVSGHVNHTDVYYGVRELMEQQQQQQQDSSLSLLEAWYLESERNMVAKYIPLVSWLLLLISCFVTTRFTSYAYTSSNKNSRMVVRMHNPKLNWAAMATHTSQFVWYRRLFVVFSCYTYSNKLTIQRRDTKRLDIK